MRRFKGRPTKREQALTNNAWVDFLAGASANPRAAEGRAALRADVPRERAKRKPSGKPLERDVLKAITAALRYDPRVRSVQRNQSGLFQEGSRFIRVGVKGLLDLTVYLKDGRYAEIEVKRPGGTPEPHQQKRIDEINAGGGIAGCADSVESALAILP